MIDVNTDTPRNRKEYLLFELIKSLTPSPPPAPTVHEVYGFSTLSSPQPTPDNPATFTDVIYTETATGNGTVLRGIGSEKDKIVVDEINHTAILERKIGVYEFDGTEDWIFYNPTGVGHGLSYALTFAGARNLLNTSICNYFTYLANCWDTSYAALTGVYTDHTYSGERFFRRPFAETDTMEKWKAWLAEKKTEGNPVKVYYILETPTTENIPYID